MSEKAIEVKNAGEAGKKGSNAKKAVVKTNALETQRIIIDAEGCTMGRLASYAAKEALKGASVVIFNAEKAVISGKESPIFVDYKRRYNAVSQTNPWRYGPKRPKNPDRFLRRVIRGMLPYTTARGRAAYERVLVYMGKPEREIEKKEGINLSKAKLADTSRFKKSYGYFMTVGHLCKYLGGKESL